jgi:UDP-glucose 4-epimerase
MNVLIIGGNGFIGSHLVDIFLKNNHNVRVFDSSFERFREKLKNVDYRISNIDNTLELTEALYNIDVVYHLASSSLPGTSNLDPYIDINKNLVPTLRLLDIMLKLGKNKIVYYSSGGTVYGNTSNPLISETDCQGPISSYGIVKVTIENYLKLYERSFGLKALILRPSNPYGPRQGHIMTQGVIATFLQRLKKGNELIVYGDGSAIKDYIYIDDLVEASYQLGIQNDSGVFNIGSGIGTSISEILNTIKDVTKIEPIVKYTNIKDYDVQRFVLDIKRIHNSINWLPTISLKDGIKKLWQWIEANEY